MGPEYLELGAGTKLRRIGTPETGGLCRQFGFTVTEARLFLHNLGVPTLQAPNGDWFNEYALELALFVALHPKMPNFRARSGDGGFSILPRMDLQRIKSRDRALLRAVCDEFWLCTKGGVEPFDGDLDDYQQFLRDEARRMREQPAAMGAA